MTGEDRNSQYIEKCPVFLTGFYKFSFDYFSGKLEHELHPHSVTLLIAKCMDEVLKQVGVTYK